MADLHVNDLIERINQLSRKQRSVGLEDGEKAEQKILRQEYLSFIRGQVKDVLERVEIVDELPKKPETEAN